MVPEWLQHFFFGGGGPTFSRGVGGGSDCLFPIETHITCIFSSYCPLQILALKTCNQGISKTITASSFKLGQLIEDND